MRPDWVTISSLATAGGTLVLAVATFSAVRSANRAARTSERSFLVGLRPVLFQSRRDDPSQKIRWVDNHWAHVEGGQASIENVDGVVYLAMSLRNVGSGIAVIQAWRAGREEPNTNMVRPDLDDFCPQTRDLYVPAGDSSFWQAAIREPDDRHRVKVLEGIEAGSFMIDVLYSDHEGGQRTISRFSIIRSPSGDSTWICSVVRHWNLDRRDPH
ncbi:MAG: hypothetical protein QOD01_124 [Actinomycetota bacterium]|nr:hypothetical protein [Actinomycetota bacterium]